MSDLFRWRYMRPNLYSSSCVHEQFIQLHVLRWKVNGVKCVFPSYVNTIKSEIALQCHYCGQNDLKKIILKNKNKDGELSEASDAENSEQHNPNSRGTFRLVFFSKSPIWVNCDRFRLARCESNCTLFISNLAHQWHWQWDYPWLEQ